MTQLTVGSLFTGVGGFDLAAERAGMKVLWQSEIDKSASTVLTHRFPTVPNLGDIHGITTHRKVDVMVGGFPCQSYSVAGNRGGLAEDRGALWWEFHRLLAETTPTWFVGENVPGLLSSNGGRDFTTIIESLVQLGYGVVWGVLDAQYFGLAQRRKRVFIVGHSGGEPRPEVLALGEGLFGHPQPSRQAGQDVAKTVTTGVGTHYDPDTDQHIGNYQVFEDNRRTGPRLHDVVAPTLQAQMGTGGNNTPMVAFAQNQRDEVRDLNDLAGALAAEPGMKQQTYIAGSTVRRLTPLECMRLQGFPDGWVDTPGNSDSQQYKQMGNALAVPVAEWIMNRIAIADRTR